MKVLVLNCGSSSIKFQLIEMPEEKVLIKGGYERVGIDGSFVTFKCNDQKDVYDIPVKNHEEGIHIILEKLLDKKYNVLNSLDEIKAVGHRMVHGGETFTSSVKIDDKVIEKLEELVSLAPLHNPSGISGIKATQKVLPNVPMVAIFDTAFHQTMPEVAYMYNIPYEYYEKYSIRKYGFHGTSHKYVSERIAEIKGRKDLKVINCHLGQGASIAAIDSGKCLDTSMGLTPLAGIPMGTRSGDVDPSIISFLCDKENMTADEVYNILNKKSGLLGLSGVSSDNRDVEKAANEGNKRAILALDSNIYLTAKYIASYLPVLGGVDVITFTAGIGENAPRTRKGICDYLKFLGVEIDEEANMVRGEEKKISTKNSKVEVWVIPTNEEIMIAKDTMKIAGI